MTTPTVLILGGGVAGMSAAHELIERGFDVTVLERKIIPGGKARSIPVFESLKGVESAAEIPEGFGPKPWVPGEHGFRFFPGFYKHVIDTMSRIPLGDGRTVEDRLVDTTRITITQFGKPWVSLPARFPRTPHDLQSILQTATQAFGPELAINPDELAFFVQRLWQVMTSCRERRDTEYEKTAWWDFIGAEERSKAYQDLLGSAITRSLVAAKARSASTKTIGDIFIQLLLTILQPHVTSSDRVLDAPTNLAWINPWLRYLQEQGVRYARGYTVDAIGCDGERITGVTATDFDDVPHSFTADYYLLAIPIERIPALLTPALTTADPKLANLVPLAKNVEWMNGIQYYLKEDIPIEHGHAIHLDTPWALTTISQAQFWPEIDLAEWGDHASRGVLSVDVSDWGAVGLNGKRARDCTRAEIGAEVWRQLKLSINADGRQLLRDENLHSWHLDPDIQPDPDVPGQMQNMEPLLVNLVDTWRLRPNATTAIPNLFLASDYVRTFTDLATMEGANEAARRAVNGILDRSQSTAERCTLWPLQEPAEFAPFWEHDRARFEAGQPWDGQISEGAVEAVSAAQKSGALLPLIRSVQAPLGITLIPHDVASRGPQAVEGLVEHRETDGEAADTDLDFDALEAPDATDLIERGLIPPHSPAADAALGDDWSDDMQRAPGSHGTAPPAGTPAPHLHRGPSAPERALGSVIPGYDPLLGSDGVVGEAFVRSATAVSQAIGGDLPAGSGGSPFPLDPSALHTTLPSALPADLGLPTPTGLSIPGVLPTDAFVTDGSAVTAFPGLPDPTQSAPEAIAGATLPAGVPLRQPPLSPPAVSVAPTSLSREAALDRLTAVRNEVAEYLDGALPDREPRRYLYGAIRDFVAREGKGLRPGLLVGATEAFGGNRADVLPLAAGLELLHNAFLVHDDIQDESELRRGAPTAHQVLGVPLAINLGDAMQALSMSLFSRGIAQAGPERGPRLAAEVERMNLETLEGQAVELGWIRDATEDVRPEDYLEMVRKKTSEYTFTTPLRLGAIAAGVQDDRTLDALTRFGTALGAAFQIRDDVLNLTGGGAYGKEIGGDLFEGKRTLVLIETLERASPSEQRWIRSYLAKPRSQRLPREVALLRGLVRAHGGIERATETATQLATEARAELRNAFSEARSPAAVAWLGELTNFVLDRAK